MSHFAAQYLIVLGILHIIFGVVRYRKPLLAAVKEGFVGRFAESDERRAAFWFISVGPLIGLIGLFTARAALARDIGMLLSTGICLSVLATIGLLAFPKSPLWALLPPSVILIACGAGMVS